VVPHLQVALWDVVAVRVVLVVPATRTWFWVGVVMVWVRLASSSKATSTV
jgi:hypothetical protein